LGAVQACSNNDRFDEKVMKNIPNKILIATANRGKVKEIRELVRDLPLEFISLTDLAEYPEVVEDGATFEENALKKARVLAAATNLPSIADDSGLCVDALGGRPGVFSARYAGEGASDEDKCRLILEQMRDVPDRYRSARFVCVLAFVRPDGDEKIFRGACEGWITRELRGSSGFGYDPIFFYEQAGLTFAEMDRESKNKISHRGRALRALSEFLKGLI
jgi:XTP/dITP diphosphohydrolase